MNFHKLITVLLSAIFICLFWIGINLQVINLKIEMSNDKWSDYGIKVHVENLADRPMPVQLVKGKKWNGEAHRYEYSYYGKEPLAVKVMSSSTYSSSNGYSYSYQTPFPVKIYTGYGRNALGKYGDTFNVPIPIRVAK